MAESIQIPKFVSPTVLPQEAITAPDAPMSDAPSTKVATVDSAPLSNDFLSSVRETNLKRQEDKVAVPKSDVPVIPVKEDKKADVTPPVFKRAGEQEPKADSFEEAPDNLEDFTDPLDVDATPDKSTKPKNIKELKTHLKTSRAREAQLRTRVEELEAETTRLASFQEKIEEHEALKERIATLETYERIFDIHSNSEFQEKYITGAEAVANQAKEIAKQYGVKDVAIIDQALKLRNRKELNDFLKRHIGDEIGVQDIRPYIFHLQALDDERVQLEKSPEQAREILSTMYKENEEKRVATVSKSIHDRSVNAWNQITAYYSRGETAIEAFKDKPGDPDHTERKTSILARANNEYIKTMGAFAALGTREIPAAMAHTLAARFQLSEYAGEAIAENKVLKQQVADLTKQLNDTSTYTRPSFNSTNNGAPMSKDELPKGGAISEHVFNKARDQINGRVVR